MRLGLTERRRGLMDPDLPEAGDRLERRGTLGLVVGRGQLWGVGVAGGAHRIR